MNEIRQRILDEAFTWRGTPWHHRAMVKGVGVDCAHFLIGVMKGVSLPAHTDQVYPRDWHKHRSEERFLEDVRRYCDEISFDEMQPADLIMFKYGRCFSHGAFFTGIVNGQHHILHAVKDQGVVISYLSDANIGDRPQLYFRHKALA